MTTHVFIVNESTFPAHLEYMFAGTSSGKKTGILAYYLTSRELEQGITSYFTLKALVSMAYSKSKTIEMKTVNT